MVRREPETFCLSSAVRMSRSVPLAVLEVARHAPAFGGWFLGRLAALARRSPGLFLRLATTEMPGVDRRALEQPGMREVFLAGYAEAFRRGSRGVAQDLRVLTQPWGFQLGSIKVPASIHHGDADTTVPPEHARLLADAIPGARLQLYPAMGTSQSSAQPGRCSQSSPDKARSRSRMMPPPIAPCRREPRPGRRRSPRTSRPPHPAS